MTPGNQAVTGGGKPQPTAKVKSGATEIELLNLTMPHNDIERFGVRFVASPRRFDVSVITGDVTHNIEISVRKAYEVMPYPKLEVAVGDDASDGGIWRDTFAVNEGVERIIPVDLKIPANHPSSL